MKMVVSFIFAILIVGCMDSTIKPIPLPKDKLSYEGVWRNKYMVLRIERSGMIHYQKDKWGMEKNFPNCPIVKYSNDGFKAYNLFYNMSFKIDQPPKKIDGKWIMVVDGEKLEKFNLEKTVQAIKKIIKFKPLPKDKENYQGTWSNQYMTLQISKNGIINYKKNKGNIKRSLSSIPIMKFEGNNFMAGIGFLNTTFNVQKPPKKINGKWVMVVDGERLVKQK